MMRRITVSEFLQTFSTPPLPLHHREPLSDDDCTPWVFWSGSENTAEMMMIQEKIKSCFSSCTTKAMGGGGYICQFWAPVDDGGRLLSTSGQPFAVGGYLSKEFAMYRQYSSEKHMDVIRSTFMNRLSSVNQLQSGSVGFHVYVTLPICLGSLSSLTTTCIGVLECTSDPVHLLHHVVLELIENLKEADLGVFPVYDLIPFETIDRLDFVKDEIDVALKVVCGSHDLALAQVWIACEDKSIKMNDCVFDIRYTILDALCDVFPSVLARSTLINSTTAHLVEKVRSDLLIGLDGICLPDCGAFTVCLRSDDTGDFKYVFEFIWTIDLNLPELFIGILSTLKECLPSFKFASGDDLCERLYVWHVGPNTVRFLVSRKRSSSGNEENHHGGRKRRKENDSSSIICTNEKNNLAIPKTVSLEADYGYGIIECEIPVWRATYANVEKEISKKLGGTYEHLEYLDEDEDWILLEDEQDMDNCIRTSRILAQEMDDSLRIQLRVTLSHKCLIGPFGILSINK